jgi:hypothetical protein
VEGALTEKLPPPEAPHGFEEHTVSIYNEDLEATIVVHLICACEAPQFKQIDGDHLMCVHCDNPCNVVDCIRCKYLDEFEAYPMFNEETDGEEDSDL